MRKHRRLLLRLGAGLVMAGNVKLLERYLAARLIGATRVDL